MCIQASGIALRLLGVWECGSVGAGCGKELFSSVRGNCRGVELGVELVCQARHTHVTEFGR
jgi:hypothetical protein